MVFTEAAKVEDKQQRNYELVLIVSPEVKDEALDTRVEKISQLITEKGGVISEVDRWGTRKLAYPIHRFTEGSYVLIQLKLKPTTGKELESNLQISEDILRYLLIKLSS